MKNVFQPDPLAPFRMRYSARTFGYLVGAFLRKLTRVQTVEFRVGLMEGYGE